MTEPANASNHSFKYFAACLVALFLVVLGAKLWIAQLYGSPLLLWDQWFEAKTFIKPWLEGQLTWKDFVAPYCEHRILFTRLLDVGTIWLNGRWEPMLEMTANAFICAAYVCGLALCLWQVNRRKDGWLICFLLLPFFALPYAAENTIWAFNSQAYFLAFFALPAMAGLGFGKPGGWFWWLGLIAAVLDLFTMASGLFTSLAIAGLVGLRIIRQRKIERAHLLTLGASLAVVGLGAALYVPYEGDRPLRAQNFMQFLAVLERNLAWPFFDHPVMACLIFGPLIWLLVSYFRRDFEEHRAAEFPLVLALWGGLQCLALAYGRGNFGETVPASRFMDKLNILPMAGVFALFPLARFSLGSAKTKKFTLLIPLMFTVMISFGLVRISKIVVSDLLVPTRTMNMIAEERVASFRASGNPGDLLEPPTVRPDPQVALDVLQDPALQPILPGACQAPTPAPVSTRLARVSEWLQRNSIVLLYAGLGGFVGILIGGLIRSPLGLAWENTAAFTVLLALLAALGFVWSNAPMTRQSVELKLQTRLADYFKSVNHPRRAAIYQAKADALRKLQEGAHANH